MKDKWMRLLLAAVVAIPGPLLVACEREDVQDVREGARDAGRQLDEAEDKLDEEIGDNDKGKD